MSFHFSTIYDIIRADKPEARLHQPSERGKYEMKLIYLWIESYRHIKEQGYLLNAGYDVKYDKGTNWLSISEKASLDKMLYGDKISIAAIVGDNGAGKSTLLDAVRAVLFDKDRRGTEITGFLIWEDARKVNVFSFMEEKKKPRADASVEMRRWPPDDFDLVYYSDFLDEKYYLEEFDDGENESIYMGRRLSGSSAQKNISTAYLLRKNGSVLNHFHSDTKRQMDFYGSLREGVQPLPFPAPAGLSVKIEFLKPDVFDRVLDASLQAYEYMGMGHHGEINTTAYVIGLLKEMDEAYEKKTIRNLKPLSVMQILQWDIFAAYLYNLLAERMQAHEQPHDYEQIDKCVKLVIPSEEVEADTLWEELEKVFSQKLSEEESFEDYLSFYHETVQMLERPKNGNFHVEFHIPEQMMQLFRERDQFSFVFPIMQESHRTMEDILDDFPQVYMDKTGWNGDWDREGFMRLYDSYMKISYEIDFLKCSWGMSSGESSMFNLFARLHAALRRWEQRDVILILDELDSWFHPQWQQKIMDFLTRFLRTSYPQRAFQVILTTHSPVLLSDIPRENVIFMQKESVVEKDHEQTFAANIASLYYDSFFMEAGSIGEVAKGSIVHLLDAINELEKEKPENNRGRSLLNRFLQKQYPEAGEGIPRGLQTAAEGNARKLLQMLINHIGEDIWRYKANEQFHRFLEDSPVDREREIRRKLSELGDEKGQEFVRELLRQYLREEER